MPRFFYRALALAKEDLSRRNFSEGRCSMKITEDVRKYAAERSLTDAEAIESGLQEKKKEFLEKGAEVYTKA